MDIEAEKALEHLRSQRDKLEQMLQITQKTELQPSAAGMDGFVDMVKKRETVLDEIKAIDEMLKSSELAHVWQSQNDAFNMEAERIKREIQSIVGQIAHCDEENKGVCQAILSDLKRGLKDVNNQKNVNTYYQYDQSLTKGSYFDKRK